MGPVIFLQFSLKCFDLLAWPLFALGFPLCASIRAIETNSKTRLRKLITYWILFSLISLFELVFAKLIDWVPYWQYIKLIAICWLVIPRFNGAYYVYQRLVHPCLSPNLQLVINHSYKLKEESSLKTQKSLALAEKYIKGNGSEALEKLILSERKDAKPNHDVEEIKAVANSEKNEAPATVLDAKPNHDVEEIKAVAHSEKNEVTATIQSTCKKPCVTQKDIKAVKPTEKNAAAAAKCVKREEANHGLTEKKTVVDVEVKEMISPAAGEENKLPEIPAPEKVEKKWTCAVCQVRTQSEVTLTSHLLGKKHKARCEQLKAMNAADKNRGSLSSLANKSNQANLEPKKFASADASTTTTTPTPTPTPTLTPYSLPHAYPHPVPYPNPSPPPQSTPYVTLRYPYPTPHLRLLPSPPLPPPLPYPRPLPIPPHGVPLPETGPCLGLGTPMWDPPLGTGCPRMGPPTWDQSKTKPNEKVQTNLGHHQQGKHANLKNAGPDKMQQSKLCSICNMKCSGKIDMAAHLKGRRHLEQVQYMKSISVGSRQA